MSEADDKKMALPAADVPENSSHLHSSENDANFNSVKAPAQKLELLEPKDVLKEESPPPPEASVGEDPRDGDKSFCLVEGAPIVDPDTQMGLILIAPDSSQTSFKVRLRTLFGKVAAVYEQHKSVEANFFRYYCEGQRLELKKRFMDHIFVVEEFLESIDGTIRIECLGPTEGGGEPDGEST